MKKEMLINVLQSEECRIAIVEDGVLEELYVERTSLESYTGNIYKGRIVNLEPAIQAGFVDFSVGRNGFLHVSDVEPQYYARHAAADADVAPRDREGRSRERDPRRDDRRRPPRPEAREADDSASPPPRDRDRPDRSERGRRDRSEPRRFGEGLIGDDSPTPSPKPMPPSRPAPPEPLREDPPRFPREEPRGLTRPEPKAPPASSWDDDLSFGRPSEREIEKPRERDRAPERGEARSFIEPEPPRTREPEPPRTREPEPFDPDLPPSRTHRQRPAPPASRRPSPEIEESGRDRSRLHSPEPRGPEPEPTVAPPAPSEPDRDPRRARGRGRVARPSIDPETPPESEGLEAASPSIDPGPARPSLETRAADDRDDPPRRRGRDAIRSRGGDRDAEPDRPRALDRERERDREKERPRAPDRDRPAEIAPERPRPAERERPRALEPEPPRERSKPHDRAGEPGYVPRRERGRGPDSFAQGFDTELEPESEPASALEWATDLEPETEDDANAEAPGEEGGAPSAKGDGPRRRRRRRRGRRERERPPGSTDPNAVEDDENDLEGDAEDELEIEIEAPSPVARRPEPPATRRPEPPPARRPEPPATTRRPEPPASRRPEPPAKARERPSSPIEEDELDQDFDFDEDSDIGRFDDDLEGDFRDGEDEPTEGDVAVAVEDDGIDPGLEEEIRREAEEIAELEREMGLRGTTEARPRRGDDRDPEEGTSRGPGRSSRGRGTFKPPIQEIFRRGDEVLVQVIKESIGTKGPTLSTYISIPGRYLVLMPGLNRVGVSRKIADEGQRRKLRDIMNDLNPPKGLGFIVRTAGLERTKRELARDLAYLLRLWKVILKRIKKARGPAVIYQESDMITRTIRDIFTSEIDTIWIDEPQAFERAQEFLRVVMPKFVNRLKLYDERVPLFHKYGIEDEIAKIQRRHVPLPEGGSIVIDQTEALVAIDVNSGNFRVENDAEKTAYEMNLRAAKEIARQLRLRDLGGVIVNDFIDMRDERHRRGVERALRDAIKRDRARTKLLRMSAFGLIEMTRQRIRPSLKRSVYEDCAHCGGAGVVKTVESMSIDVMRLLALASHREEVRRVHVSVCPGVALHLCNRKRREIAAIETSNNMVIHVKAEEGAPAEYLQIECFDGNNSEIRLQAMPAPPRRSHWHKD